jgi:hypothetical protein
MRLVAWRQVAQIMADSSTSVHPIGSVRSIGIEKTARWFCDVFRGTADALAAESVITLDELLPHKGRGDGRTVFLPNGEPCPPNVRAWREPGFKVVERQSDGTYIVAITVGKVVQAERRKAQQVSESAAAYERQQQHINEELAKRGAELRNWQLQHTYGPWHETWEGTKAQLQAEGLGMGLNFPGEPEAPEAVSCKCPLGFVVQIKMNRDGAKAVAGIFVAESCYTESTKRDEYPEGEEPTQFAPGVIREAWWRWARERDTYVGSASALVDAGLVPSVSLFPGQSGVAKTRVVYAADWTRWRSGRGPWHATITKKGKTRFAIALPVDELEASRRGEIVKATGGHGGEQWALAEERRKLRVLAQAMDMTVEDFRAEQAKKAEDHINWLWRTVFCHTEGAIRFDIPEDSELSDDLAEAFQTIRDVVASADVIADERIAREAQHRLRLGAARNDNGLQSLLKDAKHLRLVHPASDTEEG